MVTRTVVLVRVIPSSEAAALAATETESRSSAAADSITVNAPIKDNEDEDKTLQTNSCDYSTGLRADHGGLVQLCRHRGCTNVVDFERRSGLCYIHLTGKQIDSSDLSVEKKRALPSPWGAADYISGKEMKKRRKADGFVIDLRDVPKQQPIPKSKGRAKEGASKYAGVYFDKAINKWQASIKIDGKQRHIGYYENEEEAAVNYASAVFKYKGQQVLDKTRRSNSSSLLIDVSDVPPQPLILKSKGKGKQGASKYAGVTSNKKMDKWQAQIFIKGKKRHVGCYENEEEAAIDYARAVYKYKGQGASDKGVRTSSGSRTAVDLIDVPPQLPIPKSKGHIKEGASKYTGVHFNKPMNKWQAGITIEGKSRHIGCYENEEEAAADYARTVFKYKGQGVLDKMRERTKSEAAIDLLKGRGTSVP